MKNKNPVKSDRKRIYLSVFTVLFREKGNFFIAAILLELIDWLTNWDSCKKVHFIKKNFFLKDFN